MLKKASEIRVKSGKPRIFILADMVWCGIRYQAGYMDYALFEMHEMNHVQRASILTRGKNNRFVSALNSRSGWPYFESKIIFLKTFSNYIGRRWVDLSYASFEAFRDFAAELGRFIAKPPDGTHGDGVELITVPVGEAEPGETADGTGALLDLYNRLKNNGQTLCEEVIVQHEGLSSIYSGSVNTIRTVTILNRGEAHVVAAYLRIGNAGRVVDNFNNGGMVVPVDATTGRVSVPAADKAGHVYDVHPVSGAPIVGAQIPLWPECLALVKSAAQVMPMVRYVGWDIAVTPNGPILVEGNQFPGHDIYGLPAQTPHRIGILPAFEAVVPLKSLKHL
jgi:archaellum component FlaF (FlaF/FlaG flagellin family)